MARRYLAPLLLAGLASAVGAAPASPAAVAGEIGGAEPGAQALVAAGCTLCHVGSGLPVAARVDACSGCHLWIRDMNANPAAREKALALFPKWARYEQNLRSYYAVPSLDAAAARLDPAWVVRYLADPHDLRPGMPETMPRFRLDPATVSAIEDWFAARTAPATPGPEVDPARAEAGRALFEARGCLACHSFGARYPNGADPAAPDLVVVRDRMSADRARAWIQDPRAVSAAATMPALGLTTEEATAVRDFLYTTDRSTRTAGPEDVVRFLAAGSVTGPAPADPRWADVEERVFGRICVHCHMDPAQNDGRRGPGNAGGFGWPATGIELQTWEGVVANEDAIVAALDRRVVEGRRDCLEPGVAASSLPVPVKPGMPLGLPPLAEDDLAMVKRWFAAGAPR